MDIYNDPCPISTSRDRLYVQWLRKNIYTFHLLSVQNMQIVKLLLHLMQNTLRLDIIIWLLRIRLLDARITFSATIVGHLL